MDPYHLLGAITGILTEGFLRYPVTGSLVISTCLYFFVPVCSKAKPALEGLSWVGRCAVAFGAIVLVIVLVIPPLQIVSVRVILRPTPSCSTEMDPRRLLCAIVNENQIQTFYESTRQSCVCRNCTDLEEEPGMSYYVISSWIPAPNHFRTRTEIVFDTVESTEDQCFILPKGRCIRTAGPTGEDPLKVEIIKWKGRKRQSFDKGFINRSSLEEFNTGFYVVSNCKTDFERWLFSCTIAYVNAHYVRLPTYMRILLLEDWNVKQNQE